MRFRTYTNMPTVKITLGIARDEVFISFGPHDQEESLEIRLDHLQMCALADALRSPAPAHTHPEPVTHPSNPALDSWTERTCTGQDCAPERTA